MDATKEARLSDFEEWLKAFSDLMPFSQTISHAGKLLNQFYWDVVEAYIRPLLIDDENRKEDDYHHPINRFKIISATELTIMAVLPFSSTGKLNEEEVNARFAWYCANAILKAWEPDLDGALLEKASTYKEFLGKSDTGDLYAEVHFRKEHIQLLATLDTKVQLPVLSNAQTWRMFYFCVLALQEKMQ